MELGGGQQVPCLLAISATAEEEERWPNGEKRLTT
jgi:hypothetical protein